MRLTHIVFVLIVLISLHSFAGPDSSWGNSSARPKPVADSKGRSGHWWFPRASTSDTTTNVVWGNHGIVYSAYIKETEPTVEKEQPEKNTPSKTRIHITVFYPHFLFKFDGSELNAEGKAEAEKVIPELKEKTNIMVELTGHTCNIGSTDYNMELGLRRAEAVKVYLVERGVDPERISTESKGETHPAVENSTPNNRKFNRRVEWNQYELPE